MQKLLADEMSMDPIGRFETVQVYKHQRILTIVAQDLGLHLR
jgi:hypothetical protein